MEPEFRKPAPDIIAAAGEIGIQSPGKFPWMFVGTLREDQSRVKAVCSHRRSPSLIHALPSDLSRKQLEAMHADDYRVQRPKPTKDILPIVVMNRYEFARGETRTVFFIGQCGDCGAILWGEADKIA